MMRSEPLHHETMIVRGPAAMPGLRTTIAHVALFASLASGAAHAQGVGINATGAAADTSAILDLAATSKGFLAPRMSSVQRTAIVLPATGLVVYQIDGTQGLYWNAGTPAAPDWKRVGEAGAGGASQWVTNGANIHYSLGNVGIQRSAPVARLDVLGGNWDVAGGEGDFRIGDGATRLKIGIATSGGGTGAATIMEHGPAGAYNVLSLGTQGNKVLHVNGATQRVGIGTDAPNAPLGFPPALGKKITLYPGATGDVGIGVAGNRLQLYADNPNADVAMGYDQAGVFTERFAVKPTGALAVNGNAGATGQVLQSNGAGAAAAWVSPTSVTYNSLYQATSTISTTLHVGGPVATVPGLSQSFSVGSNARVLVSVAVPFETPGCLCGAYSVYFDIVTDGVVSNGYALLYENQRDDTFTASLMVEVGPGVHTIRVDAHPLTVNDLTVGGTVARKGTLLLQVVPQ